MFKYNLVTYFIHNFKYCVVKSGLAHSSRLKAIGKSLSKRSPSHLRNDSFAVLNASNTQKENEKKHS
jgi:hypothetical protein